MDEFTPQDYGPVFGPLVEGDRFMPLGPGEPDDSKRSALTALTVDAAFADMQVVDRDMAISCVSGVWLLHNFLDASHRLSQGIETPTGSFWHGIMHRREPDYSNAKHWFNRVGDHETFPQLREEAENIIAGAGGPDALNRLLDSEQWDPFTFVDLCEQAAKDDDSLADFCRRIQQREWEILFDYCFRQATGG
jgi:hypothetical protein